MNRRCLSVFWCFLICGFGLSNAQFTKQEGDSCQLASGGPGICRTFDDCDLNLLNREPPNPAICSVVNGEIIVCCPSSNSPPSPQPQPNIDRQQTFSGSKSKSEAKCEEYQQIRCGDQVPTIIGGKDVVSIEQYPHMALLGYGNPNNPAWLCGGTLISEQFILTAAHCLNGNDRAPVSVAHLGFLDKRDRNQFRTLQEFRIVETFRHPNRKAPSQYADIALLKLDRPANLTKAVLPACLHLDKNINSNRGQAIGWGDVVSGSRQGTNILQTVTVTLRSHDECNRQYPISRRLPQGIVDEHQLCAGDPNRDTCQGDSGGPLQITDATCMAKIIGVTSFGDLCGIKAGVYTRVSHYVPWIENIVWP